MTPVLLIDQWISELNKIAPNQFDIIVYHGPKSRTYKKEDFEKCDIVLTTLGMMGSSKICPYTSRRGYDDFDGKCYTQLVSTESIGDPVISRLPSGFFRRVIMDECHEIAAKFIYAF